MPAGKSQINRKRNRKRSILAGIPPFFLKRGGIHTVAVACGLDQNRLESAIRGRAVLSLDEGYRVARYLGICTDELALALARARAAANGERDPRAYAKPPCGLLGASDGTSSVPPG